MNQDYETFNKSVDIAFEDIDDIRKFELLIDWYVIGIVNMQDRIIFLKKFSKCIEDAGWIFSEFLGNILWEYPLCYTNVDEVLESFKIKLIELRNCPLKYIPIVNKHGNIVFK